MPRLTDQEKQEIIRYLEADKPLPDKYRFLLFRDKRRNKKKINYKIYAALSEEINLGEIWLNDPSIKKRSVVKIINQSNNKKTFCEAKIIDDNYIKTYNADPKRYPLNKTEFAITMNQWYRDLLEIESTPLNVNLEIEEIKCWFSKLRAYIQHPQENVRFSAWLGILGFLIGIISFVISILPYIFLLFDEQF